MNIVSLKKLLVLFPVIKLEIFNKTPDLVLFASNNYLFLQPCISFCDAPETFQLKLQNSYNLLFDNYLMLILIFLAFLAKIKTTKNFNKKTLSIIKKITKIKISFY